MKKIATDINQSKQLAKILPIESADMYYTLIDQGLYLEVKQGIEPSKDDIPCWSLAALLGVLSEIQGGKPIIALDDNYITYPHISDLHTKADNLVDACYEMILKLREQNSL